MEILFDADSQIHLYENVQPFVMDFLMLQLIK